MSSSCDPDGLKEARRGPAHPLREAVAALRQDLPAGERVRPLGPRSALRPPALVGRHDARTLRRLVHRRGPDLPRDAPGLRVRRRPAPGARRWPRGLERSARHGRRALGVCGSAKNPGSWCMERRRRAERSVSRPLRPWYPRSTFVCGTSPSGSTERSPAARCRSCRCTDRCGRIPRRSGPRASRRDVR